MGIAKLLFSDENREAWGNGFDRVYEQESPPNNDPSRYWRVADEEPLRKDAYSIKTILIGSELEADRWLRARCEDRMRTLVAQSIKDLEGYRFAADFQVHVLGYVDHHDLRELVAYADKRSERPIVVGGRGFGARDQREEFRAACDAAPKPPTHNYTLRLASADHEPRLGCARWAP